MASQLLGLAEESGPSPGESELAVNPFDGLPFSSRYYELLEQRRALPIWATRFIFLEQLESSPSGVVLVSGEPGSGKSTQIPQWCAEFALARGFKEGRVTVTQPYPLAALSLAVRVADEMDLTLGQEVGYSIPQEDCTGPDTLLRFCWDRLLLQEVASTRGTGAWGVLVLDEAQERSVASDLLQGLLRNAKLGNLPGDSRVVVVTDPALEPKLQAFWGNPTIVHVPRGPGACPTPVYRDIVPTDRVEAACQAVLELCAKEAPGDVLVYLPSEEEILQCCESLSREVEPLALRGPPPRVLPLHPGHGPAVQAAYEDIDLGARKVVVTHWLADFSFSLPSIRHVIDSGLELRSVYNPQIRAESQVLRPISRCQAEARRLRARGIPPGSCICLYPESFLELEAPLLPPPRVCEENLSPMVLLLKRRQIAEPGECHFLDRPAPEALMQALEDLDYLAALDDDGNLSDLGVILSEFPLPPELAKALLASCEFDCVDEMLTLAAMLTAAPGFTHPPLSAEEAALRRALEHADGDHSSLIQVYEAFIQSGADEAWCQARGLNWAALCQAQKLRGELLELMQQIELPLSQPAFGSEQNRRDLQKALVSGYFLKVARDTDGTGNYLLLTHKHVAQLSPYCCYRSRRSPARSPPWVLYHSFSISKDNCLSIVSEIQPQMLVELAPPYFLSNLPPSESRDLLNELREETTDSSIESESPSTQEFGDACVLQ
ncbi:ATP-dependent RNA helicase DQX1 isoform X1 [Canis lupus familiaris]|uniref:ATP-dependent RNA helicase homolog DQX1 n=1 Tax=Canis lupus familiaris TaxID=9615 RepID=A0A8I3PEN7_CANLF|nr:ATP-dependent RNA helicase DQX1 isoform X1 [Canis lupus familiaris]XP_038417586.1 ATP-dependent RNA helicase DQX1 isoform X1 [Canis lupus familiaris]XP_038417587.1 ATP-dependent RNA helicase DQX1 isoform X1 [Canis lupus familiaris]XP_038547553.1 ATP-dependent RNA helicase DQX1 isoform X1 [Canis lupus familiaris]XP_038547554.1 ATP-dependent RNA helicase DQX1 isoform X1 [Canis lupus familiaris]XP_038547555.1 ATP-dependent RNA helicase DQX1 isoform X1 [Canis lupus familiaris]|eukprot:XP_005630576.1 ATP-dependent RNA helicase DQX1 isoform X1 [Canis lupus familiaris]